MKRILTTIALLITAAILTGCAKAGTTLPKATYKPTDNEYIKACTLIVEANAHLIDSELYIDKDSNDIFMVFTNKAKMNGYVQKINDKAIRATWDKIAESVANLSIMVYTYAPNFTMSIRNPDDVKRAILLVRNGEILYNFAE
jgi:PBP1b-binding outer membrane lipoprotein LpoB